MVAGLQDTSLPRVTRRKHRFTIWRTRLNVQTTTRCSTEKENNAKNNAQNSGGIGTEYVAEAMDEPALLPRVTNCGLRTKNKLVFWFWKIPLLRHVAWSFDSQASLRLLSAYITPIVRDTFVCDKVTCDKHKYMYTYIHHIYIRTFKHMYIYIYIFCAYLPNTDKVKCMHTIHAYTHTDDMQTYTRVYKYSNTYSHIHKYTRAP